MEYKHQIVLILCLATLSSIQGQTILATLTPDLPGDVFRVGTLNVGEFFAATVTWTGGSSLTAEIQPVGGGAVSQALSTGSSFTFTASMAVEHFFRVVASTQNPVDYSVAVTFRGVTTHYTDLAVSYNYNKKFFYYNLLQCSNPTVESSDSNLFNYFNYFLPSQIPASDVDIGAASYPSSPNISISLTESGRYGLMVQSNYPSNTYQIMSTPTIYIKCYSAICGNGIYETGQACDNGNTNGCLNCVANPSYTCGGNNPTGTACPCMPSTLIYNLTTLGCNINCAPIAYTKGLVDGSSNACYCVSGYSWDAASKTCKIVCGSINNAVALVSGTVDQCTCQSLYGWDAALSKCAVDCSAIANAVGSDLVRSINNCLCRINFDFDAPNLRCVVNCTTIPNTNGAVSGTIDQCQCNAGYAWNNFWCQQAAGPVTLATLVVDLPGDVIRVGALTVGESFSATVTWSSADVLSAYIQPTGGAAVSQALTSGSSFTFTATMAVVHFFRVVDSTQNPVPYSVSVTYRGVTTPYTDLAVSYNYNKKFFYYNLQQCASPTVESADSGLFSYFNYFLPSQLPASDVDIGAASYPSASNISISLGESGRYGLMVQSNYPSNTYQIMSTATIHIKCYSGTCGNGIYESGEACDNGNTTGCLNCVANSAYTCGGNNPGGTPCPCFPSSLIFNMTSLGCNINCASIAYTKGLVIGTTNACYCATGFLWDSVSKTCKIVCGSISNATTLVSGTVDQCGCQAQYNWDSVLLKCVVNCTAIVNAVGYDAQMNTDRCLCIKDFSFDIPTLTCVVNCSGILNSLGPVSGTIDQCTCASGYTWQNFSCQGGNANSNNNASVTPQNDQALLAQIGVSPVQAGLVAGVVVSTVAAAAAITVAVIAWKAKTAMICVQQASRLATMEPPKSPEVFSATPMG